MVRHLAGGHPRIWIFFAGIITAEPLGELVPIFLQMLDGLTPYYQSRMKELPRQQRKIVDFPRLWYSRSESREKYASLPSESAFIRRYHEDALKLRDGSLREPYGWQAPLERMARANASEGHHTNRMERTP